MRAYYIDPLAFHGALQYDHGLCNALSKHASLTLATARNNPFLPRATYEGLEVFSTKDGLGLASKALRYAAELLAIFWHMTKNKPAIVHFEFPFFTPAEFLFLWLSSRVLKAKLVFTAHDLIPFNEKPFDRWFMKRIYQLSDAIVVHSQANRAELLEELPDLKPPVHVVPHGNYFPFISVTHAKEAARSHLGLPQGHEIILFFGMIKPIKGLDHLLKAMALIKDQHPNACLLIAGKVWMDDFSRYQTTIEELGLASHVISHVRFIEDEDVAHYYAAADVVALPYLKIYTSGVAVLSSCYGKPIVASAIGGIPEVVEDGVTGVLVPPADPQALADALGRILAASPQEREAMGVRAAEKMRNEFSWERIAGILSSLYQSLTKSPISHRNTHSIGG